MTDLRDPPRWKGASDAPAGFDELVGVDEALAPDAPALRKMFAGVAAELGRPELPGALEQQLALQSASAVTVMPLAAKIAVGLAVVALAAGAMYRSVSGRYVTALRAGPAPVALHRPALEPAAVQPAALIPAVSAAVLQPTAAALEHVRALPPARAQRARAAVVAGDELALLERAQRALEADPAAALGLAERHRRQFARGDFAQEREILAIEALTRLGRLAAARRRAATFMRVYPDSSHRVRLEAMLRTVR